MSDPADMTRPAEPGVDHIAFGDRLRTETERLVARGLETEDVILAAAVAQLFPGVFASALDASGRYCWVSPSLASIVGIPGPSLIGRSIFEYFNAAWCRERVEIIRRVLDAACPLATIEIFRGRRLEAAVFPAPRARPTPMVIYVGRFGLSIPIPDGSSVLGSMPPQESLLEADWGSLASLTRRELEVLRLISRGLDNDSIAREIHRSKRAVEWHIQNLYGVLTCHQRTDLFRFGLQAGLAEIDNAHWDAMMARFVNPSNRPVESPAD